MRRIRRLAVVCSLSLLALRAEPNAPQAANPVSPAMVAAHEAFAARRDDEAQAAFEQLVTANPENHEAVYYLGRLAKRRGDWQTTAAHYERCTQLAPANALYWADLGEAFGKLAGKAGIFQQLGLARKCRTALEKAVELEPENFEYRLGLIQFYEKAPPIAGGGRGKALAQAAEIAKRDPFTGMMETAAIHARAENVPSAEAAFREASKLRPDATEPLAALGRLYADVGRFPDAFAQFDALLARDHDNFAALYELGRVAALSGLRLADGEAALRRYLELPHHPTGQPTNAQAQLRLGDVLDRRGDKAGARAAYAAALRLDPGLKSAAEALRRLGP